MSGRRLALNEVVAVRPKRAAAFIHPYLPWLSGLTAEVRCPACGRFRLDVYPQPVDVKIYSFARGLACGFLFDFCIGIIHKELYREIGLDRHGFVTGRCFKGNGESVSYTHLRAHET